MSSARHLGLVWVIFTLLATVAVCYAVNQVLSPRPLDQTIAVSSPSPAPAGKADVTHQLSGRPTGGGRAVAGGTVRQQGGSTDGSSSQPAAKPAAKPATPTPLSRVSPGSNPDSSGGQTDFGNTPSDPPPSQNIAQPTQRVDGQHGSVTFTFQDGKMGVEDPTPDAGYTTSVTKLQARKAIVKFTGDSTTETVLAQVSDAGDWTISITEVS